MTASATEGEERAGAWDKFKTLVVVVSTGRTGTQALAHHLDASYPDVTALHEPRPSRHLRLLSNQAVAGKLPRHAAVRALVRSRQRLFARTHTPVYVESNWYVYGLLEAVREIAPRVKVLHVVRDPRTYIPSGINFGQFRGLRAIATRFLPYWYLKPEHAKDPPALRWSQMTDPQRLAWHWTVCNGEIDRVAPLFGDNYLFMKYEEIFSKDAAGLGRLLAWMGLEENASIREKMREKKVNASTARRCPKWEQWEPAERKAVLDMCGERMQQYGYDLSTER
jgi:hypothetical protein